QNIQMRKSIQNRVDFFAGIQNILNVKPPQPILRPNDPFNRNIGSDGLFFDATYNYAPNQGIKGFIGFRYYF
ncbi:MAG: hypothetical protein NZ522_00890, partial [Chitinophagales bacterium]|nr:hypothetical protein [Chitinophagales bacterium]